MSCGLRACRSTLATSRSGVRPVPLDPWVETYPLTYVVLDPIPTKGLTSADVDELTRSTRELMLKELIALTEETRGKTAAVFTQHSNGVAKVTGSDVKVAA
jgi:hypothetical protein